MSGLAGLVLLQNLEPVVNDGLTGQRTFGIVAFTPFVALAIAILCVVRALLAIGPSREYKAQWSARERAEAERARLAGQPSTPLLIFASVAGIIWAGGVAAVSIFWSSLWQNPDGLLLAVMLLALLAMAWIPALRMGIRSARIRTATLS